MHEPRILAISLALLGAAGSTSAQCTTQWQPLGSGIGNSSSTVTALSAFPNGSIYASHGSLAGPELRIWNGTAWGSAATSLDANINALLRLPNNDLLVGGSFRLIGGIQANRIARLRGSTWSALGLGIDQFITSRVNAIAAMSNGNIVIGGSFTTAGTVSANNIATWSDGSQTWSAMGSGMDSNVYALAALPNNQLVAGGNFSTAGGTPTSNIALWNGTWNAMGSGTNGLVAALAVLPNGHVVAGGAFSSAGGVPAANIAEWNGSSWSALGSGVAGGVNAIQVLPGGDIVVGGGFLTAGGRPASLVARWNGSWWSPVGRGFNRAPLFGSEVVAALALNSAGDVVAGGTFTTSGTTSTNHVARFSTACPHTVLNYGQGCAGSAGSLQITSVAPPVLNATYQASATGFASGAIAIDMVGTTAASTPLPLVHPAGANGCTLLVNPDVMFAIAFPSGGQHTLSLAIPDSTALLSVTGYVQAASVETGPSGVITQIVSSNGIALTPGTF